MLVAGGRASGMKAAQACGSELLGSVLFASEYSPAQLAALSWNVPPEVRPRRPGSQAELGARSAPRERLVAVRRGRESFAPLPRAAGLQARSAMAVEWTD